MTDSGFLFDGGMGHDASELAPGQPDLREAARAMLLIRSAKLVCDSGEYACLVRDVSSGGVRLRLFHALPPGPAYALELANGARFVMANRWCKGDQAGFQFAQSIDIDAFIAEPGPHPRRPIRLCLHRPGQLFNDGQAMPMILRNFSRCGAQIETTNWLALHQTVRLVVHGLPERYAHVRWRNRYEHGLAFVESFRLEDFAAYAKRLQPFLTAPAASEITNRLAVRG